MTDFLKIATIAVDVVTNGAAEREPILRGKVEPNFNGTLLNDITGKKRVWNFVTAPMTQAAAAALIAAFDMIFVTCEGDALGGAVTCYVRYSEMSFIVDGNTFKRQLSLTLQEV